MQYVIDGGLFISSVGIKCITIYTSNKNILCENVGATGFAGNSGVKGKETGFIKRENAMVLLFSTQAIYTLQLY